MLFIYLSICKLCPNNKEFYFGQSINSVQERSKGHRSNFDEGTLKKSAIKAPGTDTIITNANSLEKICLKFSLLKGMAWLFCIVNEYRFFRDRTYHIFSN